MKKISKNNLFCVLNNSLITPNFCSFKKGFKISDENLISKWFDVDKALEMLDNGEIKDAKTVIAIYKYAMER